jgi:Tol biopolymer transport system component
VTHVEAAQARAPWWSPDGRLIAIESTRRAAQMSIYVTTPDASAVLRLTDPILDAQHPKWSPDAKRIVFAGRPTPKSPFKIGILIPGEVPQFDCLFR